MKSFTVYMNEEMMAADNNLRSEKGQRVNKDNVTSFTASGVRNAVHAKHTSDRRKAFSEAAVAGADFSIGDTRCVFQGVPMYYSEVMEYEGGEEWLLSQIEMHLKSSETHANRAEQKMRLLNDF